MGWSYIRKIVWGLPKKKSSLVPYTPFLFKSLMGPKVIILMGQMANTLGSGPWAYVFAASAASAAKCFHTEVWARGPIPPGPRGPAVWKHFSGEAEEIAKK